MRGWRSILSRVETLVRFFFFQAEDGIRDVAVTGVQTCALPISVLTSSCLICDRLPVEPPDRRFAQALSSPFLKRAAAALLSHSVYHTSASPPALPPRFAFLRPSTW